jgi:flagellar protein FlbT
MRDANTGCPPPFSCTLTTLGNLEAASGESAVALKLELKPNERAIIGDCIITNQGPRTRLLIEGRVPILREKDIMSFGSADSPAKRIYLALQIMYTSKHPQEHEASYRRMAREMLKAAPGAKPFIESINNRILTGELYKALKETRKLIAYEEELLEMNHASRAYAKIAKETASPRELEASLLLKAAAQLQAVHDSWNDRPAGLNDALMYNRRLWTVFIDALLRDDNKLPLKTRNNLLNLGVVVMGETFELMTRPKPDHLTAIININRGIACGLRGKH